MALAVAEGVFFPRRNVAQFLAHASNTSVQAAIAGFRRRSQGQPFSMRFKRRGLWSTRSSRHSLKCLCFPFCTSTRTRSARVRSGIKWAMLPASLLVREASGNQPHCEQIATFCRCCTRRTTSTRCTLTSTTLAPMEVLCGQRRLTPSS